MDKKPGIRPRLGVWHQMDVASRHAFPAAQTTIVLLLLAAPIGMPGQAQIQSAWTMACIYFWSLYRPAALPALLVFGIGLLLDLMAQGPVGIGVLLLLLIHAVLQTKTTDTIDSLEMASVKFLNAVTERQPQLAPVAA